MSSGGKKVFWNTRERVVSSDSNREANLIDAELVNVLRHLFDPNLNILELGGASGIPVTTVTTPIRGHVLHGLMVVVPVGGTELAVTPGAVLLDDPDGQTGSSDPAAPNPDDSISKIAIDLVGVLAGSGDLVLTPNSSGSLRVDVVEIQRIPNLVLEADSRDIFDPSTGTFAPVTVNKVVVSGIDYRIRTGTPGAGIPAHVQGWLPIAVVSVPDTTVIWDTCTFYDVRPLVTDRAEPFMDTQQLDPKTKRELYTDRLTVPAEFRLAGVAETTCFGYRMGGLVRWNTAPTAPNTGVDDSYIDLNNTAYHEPGLVLTANTLLCLHLLFPAGLPRWVRYSQTSAPLFGGRVPAGMRGIPVLDNKPSKDAAGILPNGAITFPPAAGLGAFATTVNDPNVARVLCYVVVSNTAGILTSFFVSKNRQHLSASSSIAVISATLTTTAAAFDDYQFDKITQVPFEAKALLVGASAKFTAAGAGDSFSYSPTFMAVQPNTVLDFTERYFDAGDVAYFQFGAGLSVLRSIGRWVDVPRQFPFFTGPALANYLRVNWSISNIVGVVTKSVVPADSFAIVLGWEI